MEKFDYEKAIETLSVFNDEHIARVTAEGIINLIEGYEMDANKEGLTKDYRIRIKKLDLLIMELIEKKDNGEITLEQYKKQVAVYDAEMDKAHEAIRQIVIKISETKSQALKQFMQGVGLALMRPMLQSIDMNQQKKLPHDR